MLKDEDVSNIEGYPIIAWANGQECILYSKFGFCELKEVERIVKSRGVK